jgi:hypothetical protein
MLAYTLDKFSRNVKPELFNRHKTVTITEFPTELEVLINEAYETCQDGALYIEVKKSARGEGDRQQSIERSARRAKTQVRRRCKMIQADQILTLTYRENMTDFDRLQCDFKAFVKKLRTLRTA